MKNTRSNTEEMLQVLGMGAIKLLFVLTAFLALSSCSSNDVTTASIIKSKMDETSQNMYVIEREAPGAGDLTMIELKQISIESCDVLNTLGSKVQWLHSYVTENKIYCVFTATNEELIEEHARLGGFPLSGIEKVANVIDPSTSGLAK